MAGKSLRNQQTLPGKRPCPAAERGNSPRCHPVMCGRAKWRSVELSETGSGDFAGLEGGKVGVGLLGGFGVRLPLLVLGEGPVDAGQARVRALALADGDDQVR